jgi:hypothetical protein
LPVWIGSFGGPASTTAWAFGAIRDGGFLGMPRWCGPRAAEATHQTSRFQTPLHDSRKAAGESGF